MARRRWPRACSCTAALDAGRTGLDLGARATRTRLDARDATLRGADTGERRGRGPAVAAALAVDAGRCASTARSSQGFRAPNIDDVSTLGPVRLGRSRCRQPDLQPERVGRARGWATKCATGRAGFAAASPSTVCELSDLIERVPDPLRRRRRAGGPACLPAAERRHRRGATGSRSTGADTAWRGAVSGVRLGRLRRTAQHDHDGPADAPHPAPERRGRRALDRRSPRRRGQVRAAAAQRPPGARRSRRSPHRARRHGGVDDGRRPRRLSGSRRGCSLVGGARERARSRPTGCTDQGSTATAGTSGSACT